MEWQIVPREIISCIILFVKSATADGIVGGSPGSRPRKAIGSISDLPGNSSVPMPQAVDSRASSA